MYPETILPIVAHIPHAGTEIPDAARHQFLAHPEELRREIVSVTDWYTDELFGMPGIAVSQTPINRVVVDLERYADDNVEEKSAFGQGVIYTHNTQGRQIRGELSESARRHLLDNYYRPWHLHLELGIEQQLERWGHCLLLDCHSFPDEPFGHEEDHGLSRPDICLGINTLNTPGWLVEACSNHFLSRGYTVDIDSPYVGCLVPNRFQGDARVPAIMIEINRRLYMKSHNRDACKPGSPPSKLPSFDSLKNNIWSAMLSLSAVTACMVGAADPSTNRAPNHNPASIEP